MAYPRQLNLDEETSNELIQYLDTELRNHYAERGPLIQNLMNWQRDYWAEPSVEIRTFPFKGASNIVIPLTAITTEAVHARAMQTLFALKPFVSVKSRKGEWIDAERPIENWLDYMLTQDMKIEPNTNSIMLELEKFGTGIGKSGYERVIRTAVRPRGDSGQEEQFSIVQKDGPTLDAVAESRFLMPFYAKDPQTSPWVGEEHSSSRFEIEVGEKSGLYKPGTLDALDRFFSTSGPAKTNISTNSGDAFEENQQKLEKRVPAWPGNLTWQETWLAFNTDRNDKGDRFELQVFFHMDSRTIMSIRYNWLSDLRRPYRIGVYFPVEHRWPGIGIGKQQEQFQREITTIHRQRLDNATLANMRMFKVHKMSGYGPREPVFPGKMWFVDDMTHVDSMQLSEIYPSSFANEQASLMYGQQRSGVNEVTLGMPQQGTPGTATSDIARIQEGKQKFDFVFGNMRRLLTDLVQDVIINTAQFGTRTSTYFDIVEGGQLVRAVLSQPVQLLRDGLMFEIVAAGQQRNRVLDRQNWQQIAAILTQYYTGILQLAQLYGDPVVIHAITAKGMLAVTEALKQILESYDIRNVDRIIVSEIGALMQSGGLPAIGPAGRPGGTTGAPGPGQAPGVADLLALVSKLGTAGGNGA